MSKRYLDKSVNKYFTYDYESDSFQYLDGTSRRRPENIDQSKFLTAATPRSEQRNAPSQYGTSAGSSRAGVMQTSTEGAPSTFPSSQASGTRGQDPSYTYGMANPALSPPPTRAQTMTAAQETIERQMESLNVDPRAQQVPYRQYQTQEDVRSRRPHVSQGSDRQSQQGPRQQPPLEQRRQPQLQESRPQQPYPILNQYPPAQAGPSGQFFQPRQSSLAVARQAALDQQFEPRQFSHGDLRIRETYNPSNHVRSLVATVDDNPAKRITDPALLHDGVRAQNMLIGNPSEGQQERLYSTFKIRPHSFFVVGRVFLVLWVEPAGATTVVTGLEPNDAYITGRYKDELIFSKVRRFVIIRQSKDYCSALPIASYGNRGVGKKGVNKSEHAIIYTGTEPAPLPSEEPERDEAGMRRNAIKVVPDNPTDKLDPVSRIDFGKVHTVQHNIKVKPYGMVHKDSMNALLMQFRNAWHGDAVAAALTASSAAQRPPNMPETQTGRRLVANMAKQAASPSAQASAAIRRQSLYEAGSVGSAVSAMATYGSTTAGSRTTIPTSGSSRAYPPSASGQSVRSGGSIQQAATGPVAFNEDDSEDDDDECADVAEPSERVAGIDTSQRQPRAQQRHASQPGQSFPRGSRSQSSQPRYPGQEQSASAFLSSSVPRSQYPIAPLIAQQPRSGYVQPTESTSSQSAVPGRFSVTARTSSTSTAQATSLPAAAAAEVRYTQQAYARLLEEGATPEQAVQRLIIRHMENNPEISRSQAEEGIRRRLAYPPT